MKGGRVEGHQQHPSVMTVREWRRKEREATNHNEEEMDNKRKKILGLPSEEGRRKGEKTKTKGT